MHNPRILLLKCHNETTFSLFGPIITEPLELECVAAFLDTINCEYRINDSLLERTSVKQTIKNYKPDILLLSGYIVAVDRIIDYAHYGKNLNDKLITVVGGVHAEINYQDFFDKSIDIILHANAIVALKKLIEIEFDKSRFHSIPGIAYCQDNTWKCTRSEKTSPEQLPIPNRSYFHQHKHKTRYLNYSPVALIKTALSCPYTCTFCYCKLLNQGVYAARPIRQVVDEIEAVESDTIWLVDDTFLIDIARIEDFIRLIQERGIEKQYVVYSRVDFISCNEELIGRLAKIGLREVIVGMESVCDKKLDSFQKHSFNSDNFRTAEILKRQGVDLTALFIADIDFTRNDFRQLRISLRNLKPNNYTVSIFTPLKGTELYNGCRSKITETKNSRYDFLHLVMKPVNMSRLEFYLQIYRIYLEQIFTNTTIRKFMFGKLLRFKSGAIPR